MNLRQDNPALSEHRTVHARASAQASYGYLYVTVWKDPEGSAAS